MAFFSCPAAQSSIINRVKFQTQFFVLKYSRTSLAWTRCDRQCEFDLSMCLSDTKPNNSQVGSCVLYAITDITFFIDQSCKRTWHLSLITNLLHARVKMISRMCLSDTKPNNSQVGSCVLYAITDITFFIDQSCKRTWDLSLITNLLHARVKMISRMCQHMNLLKVNTFISMRICAVAME